MKKQKILLSFLSVFFIALILCLSIFADNITKENLDDLELYPGGMAFGAKIISNGLTVVKFSETQGKNISSAYAAGIRVGDIVTKINNTPICSINDFVRQIDKNGGSEIKMTVIRDSKEFVFNVIPKYSESDGKFKTGLWVKDSTSGIGTITYINPKTNDFGGLGHAICDSNNGKPVNLEYGNVMDVKINGVVKGEPGAAGELKGAFIQRKIGRLNKNTSCGVFGYLSDGVYTPPENMLKICKKEDVKEGEAYIWCTLDESGPKKYNIKITSINDKNEKTKNFKIKIIDKNLLNIAGGIVQGMSGSPIIQNGKLVGAVTHVLINEPTEGYGIFIENMLKEANEK